MGKLIKLGSVSAITEDTLVVGGRMPNGCAEAGTVFLDVTAISGTWTFNLDHLLTSGANGGMVFASLTGITTTGLKAVPLAPWHDGKTLSTPATPVPYGTQLDFQEAVAGSISADVYVFTASDADGDGNANLFAETSANPISATETINVDNAPGGAASKLIGVVHYVTNTGSWAFTYRKRLGGQTIDILSLGVAMVGTGASIKMTQLDDVFKGNEANTPNHAIPMPDQIVFTRTSGNLFARAYLFSV